MYQVDWTPSAENQLAAIWLAHPDRDAVTADTKWIDDQLLLHPLRFGESRSSSVHRVAFSDTLGVEFEVIEDDKRVIVQGVFDAATQ